MSYRVMTLVGFGLFAAAPVWAAPQLTPFVSGLSSPIFLTSPDGDPRQFIIEREGRIRVVENGSLLPNPFLDVSALTNVAGEQGLLGLAFAPDYASSGNFYVNYVDRNTNNNIIARYTRSESNPNLANPSGEVVLTVNNISGVTNHKAGWIGFRPGEPANLYVPTGDGGGANDPNNNAQNLNSQMGKILRVDVSGTGPAVPASGNPFLGGAAADDNIWAYGLRNPYRSSVDRVTGALIVADVGQSTREEVNVIMPGTPAGLNFGWRPLEGSGDNPGVSDPAPANAIPPSYDYVRGASAMSPAGFAASITGGYVYRGELTPELYGKYIFGDFVTGRFGQLDFDDATGNLSNFVEITSILDPDRSLFPGFRLASFGEDSSGELYVMNISSGVVYRFESSVIPEPANLAWAAPAMLLLRRVRRA